MKGTIEPTWVCFDCAEARHARIPKGHCYSVHEDVCGICQKMKKVTEPRDFGHTRILLRVVNPILCKHKRTETIGTLVRCKNCGSYVA